MIAIATKDANNIVHVRATPSDWEFDSRLVAAMRDKRVTGPGPQMGDLTILHLPGNCSVQRADRRGRPLHGLLHEGVPEAQFTFVPKGTDVNIGGELYHWGAMGWQLVRVRANSQLTVKTVELRQADAGVTCS